MNDDTNSLKTRQILLVVYVIVIFFALYEIVSAVYFAQTTGVFKISSSNSSAILTVSQQNYQAVNVGTGKASIRLKPGVYQVIASTASQQQAIKTVQISKKQTVSQVLQPTSFVQTKQGQTISLENSFILLLPFTGPNSEYKISYSYTYTSSVAIPNIIITAPTAKAQQDAVAWIKTVGFNPSVMNIQYVTAQP